MEKEKPKPQTATSTAEAIIYFPPVSTDIEPLKPNEEPKQK